MHFTDWDGIFDEYALEKKQRQLLSAHAALKRLLDG